MEMQCKQRFETLRLQPNAECALRSIVEQVLRRNCFNLGLKVKDRPRCMPLALVLNVRKVEVPRGCVKGRSNTRSGLVQWSSWFKKENMYII